MTSILQYCSHTQRMIAPMNPSQVAAVAVISFEEFNCSYLASWLALHNATSMYSLQGTKRLSGYGKQLNWVHRRRQTLLLQFEWELAAVSVQNPSRTSTSFALHELWSFDCSVVEATLPFFRITSWRIMEDFELRVRWGECCGTPVAFGIPAMAVHIQYIWGDSCVRRSDMHWGGVIPGVAFYPRNGEFLEIVHAH